MEDKRKGRKKEEVGMCPYCRVSPLGENIINQLKTLSEKEDAEAIYLLAQYYAYGDSFIQQDWSKANELWLKAGELGSAEAYFHLSDSYNNERGVEIDKKKAKHYLELSAMSGYVKARHNLGCMEAAEAGNLDRAFKHLILSARAGFTQSLEPVKIGFTHGDVTTDEYESTLRTYHKSQAEMKSEARDKYVEYSKADDANKARIIHNDWKFGEKLGR